PPACPHLAHQPETTEAPSPDGASATTYGFGSELANISGTRDTLALFVPNYKRSPFSVLAHIP
ncbi:hypothetical protein ACWD6R_40445, partial [Streptomyces sp. NPDC005151]